MSGVDMAPESGDALPIVRASDIEEAAGGGHARWLVEPLWSRAGVGILGGAPKVCKSWLALDLAVSVASGTPAMGVFAVRDPGAVLLFMAEDSPAAVKTRLAGIAGHRGLGLAALPIHVITTPVLRLDKSSDQARLREAVRAHAPRLLVLDPFVRIQNGDENDVRQVSALLGYLRALQREHDVAVLVVHHARKNATGGIQAGQSLRGSGDFHAWGDSNLYMRRTRAGIALTVEHRAAAAPEALVVDLVGDDMPHLEVTEGVVVQAPAAAPAAELDAAVLAALAHAGEPLGRGELRSRVQVRNERLGDALTRLVGAGTVVRVGERWGVPRSPPQGEHGNGTLPA